MLQATRPEWVSVYFVMKVIKLKEMITMELLKLFIHYLSCRSQEKSHDARKLYYFYY